MLTSGILIAAFRTISAAAGGSGYRFERFMLFDLSGEITWLVLFGGLGYWFGSQWEIIRQALSNFSRLALSAAALGAATYLAVKQVWKWQARKSRRNLQLAVAVSAGQR